MQELIRDKKGFFVVRACPGSGKTRGVATRLAKKLCDWQFLYRGVAAISFTNVAWQEIEKFLIENFHIEGKIKYPHFLGTIDSFINQYIFLPFGHLVLHCAKRPELIGPPYNSWEPIGNGWYWRNEECNKFCELNEFSYDVSGNLIDYKPRNHFRNCTSGHKFCRERKAELVKAGFATQSDANFFAMKVLEAYPDIARALAYRFPLIMIDEAQDTSEIQMKIIDLLIEGGIKELMLVGDPDQAIYEWRKATPSLFIQKYKDWKQNSIIFNDNWRSSGNICNFTFKISSLPRESRSRKQGVKSFVHKPEIWEHDGGNFDELITHFLELCSQNNIEKNSKNIAVLARGNDFLNQIMNYRQTRERINPWNDLVTRDIVRSKYLFSNERFNEAFKLLQRVCCKHIKNVPYCTVKDIEEIVERYEFATWRGSLYKLLHELPGIDRRLKQWVDEANQIFDQSSAFSSLQLKIKRRRKYYNVVVGDLFNLKGKRVSTTEYTLGTVHSVKGETFEAVMLILKSKAANNKKYLNLLRRSVQNEEEMRVVYVAITRPRKILVIAVPRFDREGWEQRFS